MTTKEVSIEMDHGLSEKAYNFSLKIKSHNDIYQSILSSNFMNPKFIKYDDQKDFFQDAVLSQNSLGEE
jgi:hypothetical protein